MTETEKELEYHKTLLGWLEGGHFKALKQQLEIRIANLKFKLKNSK